MKAIRNTNAFFLFINVLLIVASGLISLWSEGGQLICLFLIPILYVKYYKQEKVKERLLLNPISVKNMAILMLVTFVSVPITAFLLNLSVLSVGNQMDFLFKDEFNKSIGVMLLSLAVVPAICEEVFMRGVILTGHHDLKWLQLILFNGILFGIFHLNVNQFSYAFFLGAIFSLAVLITRSLYASMWMHFVNNAFSTVMAKYFEDGQSAASTAVTWNETLILGVVSIFALGLIVYLFNYLSKGIHNVSFVQYLDERDEQDVLQEQEKSRNLDQKERVLEEAQLAIVEIRDSIGATGAIIPLNSHRQHGDYKKRNLLAAMTWHVYVMIAIFGIFSVIVVYMAQNPGGL